jgi:glycosyltransferase involved in cell wall biosynthesis
MTSVLEGMPLVLIEAMAAGLPVVAMKADGASGLVQNNHNGILVDGGPEVFAQKIMELIDSPEKQKALGENAKKAAAQYARVEVAKRHIKLYQEVIQAAWS